VWQVPHFTVSDEEKLKLFNIIEKNNPLSIAHRRWELFTYPLLQESHSFTWVLKSSTSLEKPRFVIIGFQTDRKNNLRKDASKFDHCHLKNIKLYLNSQSYPYENLNLDYRYNQYALAYDMYARFLQSYSVLGIPQNVLTRVPQQINGKPVLSKPQPLIKWVKSRHKPSYIVCFEPTSHYYKVKQNTANYLAPFYWRFSPATDNGASCGACKTCPL
jgi:hypothetical protein